MNASVLTSPLGVSPGESKASAEPSTLSNASFSPEVERRNVLDSERAAEEVVAPKTAYERVQAILRDSTSVSVQRRDEKTTTAPTGRFDRFLYRLGHAGADQANSCDYSIVISSPNAESFEVTFTSGDNDYGLRSAIYSAQRCRVRVGDQYLSSFNAEAVLEQLRSRMDGDGDIRL